MRRLAVLSLPILLAMISGCGGAGTSPVAKVNGTVTYNGAAVPNLNIVFESRSLAEGGRPASGVTDASGKYTLSTFGKGDGAVPGEHKVYFSVPSNTAGGSNLPGTEEDKPKSPLPDKYMSGTKTDKFVKVEADKTNVIDITLAD